MEIWYTVSHTSLMGVSESLHFLSTYFYLFWNTFGIGNVHKNLLSNGQPRESWYSVIHTFLMKQMNFYLYFPYLFSNFHEIWYYIYTHTHTHNAAEHWQVL